MLGVDRDQRVSGVETSKDVCDSGRVKSGGGDKWSE